MGGRHIRLLHVGLELANVILKIPLKCWANSPWISERFGTRDLSRACWQGLRCAFGISSKLANCKNESSAQPGAIAFTGHPDFCQDLGIRSEQYVSHILIDRGIQRIGTPQCEDYFQCLVAGPTHAHFLVNDLASERS